MASGTGPDSGPGRRRTRRWFPRNARPAPEARAQGVLALRHMPDTSPQERVGLIITRSPGRHCRTAAPASRTTPAPSEPTTWGNTETAPGKSRRHE